MVEFFTRLFRSDFMPHGFCWEWEPWVVWTNVLSDLVIFLCYLIIGSTLLKLTARRRDMISNPVVALFGAFIVFCGFTHAMEVYNTWNGLFRLAGVVKGLTALVSLLAVGPLLEVLPKVLAVPALGDILDMGAALSSEQQEKRRMASRLRESEDQFRLLVEGIRDYAIFLVDPAGLITSWNPGGQQIMGYAPTEILGHPFSWFFPEEDRGAGLPGQILSQAAARERLEDEGWRIRKDGSRFLARGVITPFYDLKGEVRGYAGIIQDITELRASQSALQALAEHLEDQVRERVRELRESEARLQGFIRHSPAAIAFKGLDGRYLLLNPRMEEALRRPSDDIVGRTDEELLPPESRSLARDRDRRVLASGQALQAEEQWACGDEGAHNYLVNAFPLGDADGRAWGLGVIATDITERKRADQALLQSQKLESLGILAGGIAHDFNNLLGAMLGNLELALLQSTQARARPFLETLEGLMARGADLLKQILAYSGRGKFAVCTVQLNQLVSDLLHLLETSISKKSRVQLDLDPQLPALEADPSQLQQVVMNLVINASEAIGDQPGVITVTTRAVVLRPTDQVCFGEKDPLRPGTYVALQVSDTGSGMAPEVIRKIFDPFFTTKFTGRGLGLAAIHGIVRGHRGGIQVSSEPGAGSTFRILFPAGRPEPAACGDEPGPGSPGGVLVVDDEPALRSVMVETLECSGFATFQARDGQEALDLYWRHQGRIRLIVMDLTMPVMDGLEACRELRRRGVDIPILLTSGFDQSEALGRSQGLGLAGFIQKPFSMASLLDLVRSRLA
jgi:PAS domain S-box-containing protein